MTEELFSTDLYEKDLNEDSTILDLSSQGLEEAPDLCSRYLCVRIIASFYAKSPFGIYLYGLYSFTGFISSQQQAYLSPERLLSISTQPQMARLT